MWKYGDLIKENLLWIEFQHLWWKFHLHETPSDVELFVALSILSSTLKNVRMKIFYNSYKWVAIIILYVYE